MESEYMNMISKWLDEVLKDENFNILKYEFPNIQITGGYVSKMINVKATVEKNGKKETLDLLVKISEITPDDMFMEAYKNEVNIYSKVLPHFNKLAEEQKAEKFENIPYCYGVFVDEKHFVVVLDNLKPKGFEVRDFAPLDTKHLKLLLIAFAKWHAFSFALRDQKPEVFHKFVKPKIELEKFKLMDLTALSFEQQMDFAINFYEGKNKPNALDKLKSLRNNYRGLFEEFLKNENEEYVVICHTDVWNNNFLFKYNEESMPTEIRIIDWQTAILGSPAIDVSQIFFFCCFKEEIQYIDDLLKLYHTTISEKIKQLGSDPEKCFPWEACLKSFKRFAPLGIAGMPFLLRMYFNNMPMDESNAGTVENGNFSAILGEGVSKPEAFFERMNDILDFCTERNLI